MSSIIDRWLIGNERRLAPKIIFGQLIFLVIVMTWREANWASHLDYANRVFAMQQITRGILAPHYLIFNWSHLADHADFTIYVSAFFYLVTSSVPWIMYLQATFLCIAELFLARLAEEYFKSQFSEKNSHWIGALLALLFVTNPLILFAVTDDPHLHMFGLVAGLAIVTYGMSCRHVSLVVIGSLIILISGDLASTYTSAAIISFLCVRQLRWLHGIAILAVTVIASLIIQGFLSPVGSNFLIHYGHLGGSEMNSAFSVFATVLRNPGRAMSYWLRSLPSFTGLVASFGAIGLLVPLGLPTTILNLSSTGLALRTSVGRPPNPEWPGSFLASPWQVLPTLVIGITGSVVFCIWLSRRHWGVFRKASIVLGAGILLNSLIFGLTSFPYVISRSTYPDAMSRSLDHAGSLIPKGATVYATVGVSGHISWNHRVLLAMPVTSVFSYQADGAYFLITPTLNSGRPYSTELPLVEALLRNHARLLFAKNNVWLFNVTSPRSISVDFRNQEFSGITVPGNASSSRPLSSASMCRRSQILAKSTYFVSRLLVTPQAGKYMWNITFASSKTAVMEVRDVTTGETISMLDLPPSSLQSQSLFVRLPKRQPVRETSKIGWGPFWYERSPAHRTYRLELRIWIPYGTNATLCYSNFVNIGP